MLILIFFLHELLLRELHLSFFVTHQNDLVLHVLITVLHTGATVIIATSSVSNQAVYDVCLTIHEAIGYARPVLLYHLIVWHMEEGECEQEGEATLTGAAFRER